MVTAMMIRAQMKPHHDAIMKKLTLNSRHSEGGDRHNNIKNDTMIAEFAHRPLYMSLHPPPFVGGWMCDAIQQLAMSSKQRL